MSCTEPLGPWIVYASGLLLPALGIVILPNPSPPPDWVASVGQARGQRSTIITAASRPTVAAALAEAQAYHTVRGGILAFRGVSCFVADVVADHRAARSGESGGGIVEATWTLVADRNWAPVPEDVLP